MIAQRHPGPISPCFFLPTKPCYWLTYEAERPSTTNSKFNKHNTNSIYLPIKISVFVHPALPLPTSLDSITNMPTLSNFYTIQDVSQHKAKEDCWIIVDGKVYDVTKYLDDHPGGDDVILEATGRDATEDFEDAGHSKSARELMEQYYIGEFDTSSPIATKKGFSERFAQLKKKQYLGLSIAVVGISVIAGFLYLRKK